MKRIGVILPLLFIMYNLNAQTTVMGTVFSEEDTPLEGASVVLLQAKDSVLSKYDIVSKTGAFELNEVKTGDYLLKVTYVGFEDYISSLTVEEQPSLDLGSIVLTERFEMLDQVTVEAERIPIVINGDTIQYNADAFRTRPNASVEELIKKLPGLEVDRSGNIKAQGKDVDRVLVDGKEFFGDDPKIATQNLPAEIVDNVQVFDRKSETAEFTGVDDGERSTTINLSLKEDKKKGYFGNLEAGYGTEDRFSTKGSLNRFSTDYQLSALGRYNNINEQGFTIQDYFNLMGGMQNAMSSDNAINPRDLGINLDGDSRSDGLTTTAAGGVNFSSDLSAKTELSLNYFYNGIDRQLDRSLKRTYFQGASSTFDTQEEELRQAENTNHRLNTLLEHKIDSTQDVQLRANIGWNEIGLNTAGLREIYLTDNVVESTLDKNYDYFNQQLSFDTKAVYRRRLQKPGRSMVADLNYRLLEGMGESQLKTQSQFFSANEMDSLQQLQDTEEGQHNFSTRLSYTEPLGKGYFLELTHRYQNYKQDFDRNFFDIMGEQVLPNQLLSNQFRSDYTYNRVGLALQRNRKKSNLTIRLDVQESQLKGRLASEQMPLERKFSFLLPAMNWRHEFTSTKSLSLRYRTEVQEPSITQLQPIVDNSDPLNIYIGNADLKPEYRHQLRAQAMYYDAFSFTSFFTFLDLMYTRNRITNASTIDEQLRQSITPVNVDYDWILAGNSSFGTPLRWMKSRINLGGDIRYNRGLLLLNDEENEVNRMDASFNVILENRKKEVIDIQIGAEWGYQTTTYTQNETLDQSFNRQSYFIESTLQLGERWQLFSLFDYQVFPKGPFDQSQAFPLWEASLSRTFGAKEQLQIKLSAFDLLNQNTGIRRNATFNFIENERMLALGRYFMLSAVYQLKGFGR